MKKIIFLSLILLGAGCSQALPVAQPDITQGQQTSTTTSLTVETADVLNTSSTQPLIQPKPSTAQVNKQTNEKTQTKIAPKPEIPYKLECLNGTHMCGHECYPPCSDGKIFECSKFQGAEPTCKNPPQAALPITTPLQPQLPQQNAPTYFPSYAQKNDPQIAIEKCKASMQVQKDSFMAQAKALIESKSSPLLQEAQNGLKKSLANYSSCMMEPTPEDQRRFSPEIQDQYRHIRCDGYTANAQAYKTQIASLQAEQQNMLAFAYNQADAAINQEYQRCLSNI